MPRDPAINKFSIAKAIENGLTKPHIEMCKTLKSPIIKYNHARKGSDRGSMRDNIGLLRELLSLT